MNYTTLKPEDLEVLERLLEAPLRKDCRASLIAMYGEGGFRSKYLKEQVNKTFVCIKDCYMCGKCIPELEGPLLFLITDQMKCYVDDDEAESLEASF